MFFAKQKDHAAATLAEQTRMLFSASTPSSIATIANGTLLTVALWSEVDHANLILWYVYLLAITFARLALNCAYNKAPVPSSEAHLWANRFIVGTGMISVVWATASFFLFPSDSPTHQVFLAFVLAGMCAGAVTTLSFLKTTVLVYLSCTLTPIAFQFLSSSNNLSFLMGIMTVFFFVITSTSALRIYQSTNENIQIRFKSLENEQALRDSEAKFRSIFESAPLGLVHYNRYGVMQSYNSAFTSIVGAESNIAGAKLSRLVPNATVIHTMRAARHGDEQIFTGDVVLPGKTQSTPLRIHFRGIVSDQQRHIGGVAIVEDRTADIKVERLKNEFVSTVSHELRTPLTAIKGSLDLMASDIIKQQPKIMDDLLANARRNSDRLLNLINDILDIDKIKQGKLEYKVVRTKLMPLIEQAVTNNEPFGKQHEVGFVIVNRDDGVYVNVDGHRLGQVITNLLSNAAKFSPANSRVEISVYEQNENNVCIAIKDSGCGIPKEFHDRIFTKFSQYDGSDVRKVGGTGLGLNISKAIVEHHQGRINFISQEGQGTTFFVILPIATRLETTSTS